MEGMQFVIRSNAENHRQTLTSLWKWLSRQTKLLQLQQPQPQMNLLMLQPLNKITIKIKELDEMGWTTTHLF